MRVIRIVGLRGGPPCPFDGQYLVEYDPDRLGVDPRGVEMAAHIVCSPDRGDAKEYPTAAYALADWQRVSQKWPLREYDAQPNRPLTAFTVEVLMGDSDDAAGEYVDVCEECRAELDESDRENGYCPACGAAL